jgi:predicted nucleic acid-binding protein
LRYVIDTNVISEVRRTSPALAVRRWWDRQIDQALFLTATVAGEILTGVELLPQGRKRQELARWAELVLGTTFAGRILPFDEGAARAYAQLIAKARAQGRTVGFADAQIAAVALDQGMTVVTRDVTDFAIFGVPLVDPWSSADEPS